MARCRSIQECFQGVREVHGDAALQYHTVHWVKAFWEGRVAVQDNLHLGQPHVTKKNSLTTCLPVGC